MTQEFAYRASAELEAAARTALERLREWGERVVAPFHDEHPEAPPLWVRESWGTSADMRCVGFTDSRPDEDPPAGLSRSQKRVELIPARGRAGDPWRDALDRFGTRPKVADAFAAHGVEVAIIDYESSRLHRPDILLSSAEGEDGMWLRYTARAPRESPHLTSIPVSEFHVAREGIEGREAARAAEREMVASGGPVEA